MVRMDNVPAITHAAEPEDFRGSQDSAGNRTGRGFIEGTTNALSRSVQAQTTGPIRER